MTETKTSYTARPKMPPPPLPPAAQARGSVSFQAPRTAGGHRVLLYGPGGIGKTTLAMQAPGPVAFFDLDESLGVLVPHPRGDGVNRLADQCCSSWQAIRDALQSPGWDEIRTIVIDTATKAEELAVAHTLEHTLQDGKRGTSIEGYGFGKGYGYVFDTFLTLLGDLDRHARAGRNVILICHDCTSTVPNPAGEDWLRYEPRLQAPGSGKASIRLRVREWADHVLFIGYDVDVGKGGKGRGSGTRTLYTAELPHCMAKSRTTQEVIPLGPDGAAVWGAVIR
ncbi:MAG: AAA family ATPase [bacterium]